LTKSSRQYAVSAVYLRLLGNRYEKHKHKMAYFEYGVDNGDIIGFRLEQFHDGLLPIGQLGDVFHIH